MALLFMDGYDHYNTAQSSWKYDGFGGTESMQVGRFGTGQAGYYGFAYYQLKILPSSYGTLIWGAAIKSSNWGHAFVNFSDGATTQLFLWCSASEGIKLYRGDNTLLATGTTPIANSRWYYIEVKFTISDTVGSCVVKIDGVTEINLTGADTKNTANATVNQVKTGCLNGANGVWIDDMYICDTSGGYANDFLGDCRVETLMPNNDGSLSQWYGSDNDQISNYMMVDEATAANSDTDYVKSATVGVIDTYAMSDLAMPAGATIFGVQQVLVARRDNSGFRHIAPVIKTLGSYVVGTDCNLGPGYRTWASPHSLNPANDLPWTVEDINGIEFGVKVTS